MSGTAYVSARRWAREYARAYYDCSAWLASWCLPWAWVHGFWQTTRDLRLSGGAR